MNYKKNDGSNFMKTFNKNGQKIAKVFSLN